MVVEIIIQVLLCPVIGMSSSFWELNVFNLCLWIYIISHNIKMLLIDFFGH